MKRITGLSWLTLLGAMGGCTGGVVTPDVPDAGAPPPDASVAKLQSCMQCHNGSDKNDYAGDGITDPHPFGATAGAVLCTDCHGGNPDGSNYLDSHVPPPPLFGTVEDPRANLALDPQAEFNRRTLAGIDKLSDYEIDGEVYTAIDYLQFINPGDLRVVTQGRGCGKCHGEQHGQWFHHSPIAQSTGIFSATRYAIGVDNVIPEYEGWYQSTAADYGFRAVEDESFSHDPSVIGPVGKLLEFPESAVYNGPGVYQNPAYNANTLADYVVQVAGQGGEHVNQVMTGSPLDTLIMEQVAITCGDCHAGSAGANNRFGDFRSSGCTSCHMEYSSDGRSRSTDPNIDGYEPVNPDQIAAGERAHVERHEIRNVFRELGGGKVLRGISDKACAGCHQGSNRTVLQFWGIRLDQNRDVDQGFQYPANPIAFQNAAADTRLFDPAVNNNTFNGREADQLIALEDYDGDGRDDTPPDIHHERGLGCIDCHGSRDLHGGVLGPDAEDRTSGKIVSRMDQSVGIQCESCHGSIDAYAEYESCIDDEGKQAQCAVDRFGNALGNVTRNDQGELWLRGRIDGKLHYVPQTRDVVTNNDKMHPVNSTGIFNAKAAYAMGRVGAAPYQGPIQQDPAQSPDNGFSHTDNLDCASCHSSWTNNCIGCHLKTQYNDNPNEYFFSNITGERIVLFQANADFTYITPVPFQLSVNSRGKITQTQPNTKMFYRYQDLNGNESQVFAFTDRNGNGNNPNVGGRGAFPAMSHNALLAHSIRGAVAGDKEGPRYCVACHLTGNGLANHAANYDAFRQAIAANAYANLDFALLQQHIGQNPGNQLNSPFWVHMVAGLGSGLFLFDQNGCPVNPLDQNANRQLCADGAPADNFDANNAKYDVDRQIQAYLDEDDNLVVTGKNNGSSKHPLYSNQPSPLRDGAQDQSLAGPLGGTIASRLANPDDAQVIILDTYHDADGNQVVEE